MAKHLIISYVRSSPWHLISVYYDDAEEDGAPADYYYVEEQTAIFGSFSEITSGSALPTYTSGSAPNSTYYFRKNRNVILNDGSYVTTFNAQPSAFPYATRSQRLIYDPDVNDLGVSVASFTAPSDLYTADGDITIHANSSHTPLLARIGTSGAFTEMTFVDVLNPFYTWQDHWKITFSNLVAGTYTYTVKDGKSYERTGEITIEPADLTAPTNYGTKYRHRFEDGTGQSYQIEILNRGYNSTVTNYDAGNNPFILAQKYTGNDMEDVVVGYSTATVQLLSTTFREWEEFINDDEDDWKVKFSRYESGAYVSKWEGFLVTEGITEDLYQPPYIISLLFTDRLKDMEAHNFLDYSFQSGGITVKDVIANCLEKTKLYLGYRISVHLWESDQDDTTDTPLHQTYANREAYAGKNKREVLEYNLATFGAIIYQWEGYWYIERIKEKKEATVNYLEYDSDFTYVGTGSYSPRASFKGAQEANRWRWKGRQTQNYTPVFGQIDLTLLLGKKDLGLSTHFGEADGWSAEDPPYTGVASVNVLANKTARIRTSRNTGSITDYIQKTGTLECDAGDSIKMEMDAVVKIVDQIENTVTGTRDLSLRAPYFNALWSLKVGDYWLDLAGQWNASETINQQFGDSLNSAVKVEVNHPLYGDKADRAYVLRIYGTNIFDADISNATSSGALTTLRSVVTTSLPLGSRRSIKWGGSEDLSFAYFELRDRASGAEDGEFWIVPSDHAVSTNEKAWIRIAEWDYDHGYYSGDALYGAFTETTIKNFDFELLPNSEDPPEEKTLTETASQNNVRKKEVSMYHFDYPTDINSSPYLYKNGYTLQDGSPTAGWIDADLYNGEARTIQQHRLRLLKELYVRTRTYVNGSFVSDEFVTPKNVLHHPGDDGRIYLQTGVSFDYKRRAYNGEVVEIGRDTTPQVGDYNSSDYDDEDYSV